MASTHKERIAKQKEIFRKLFTKRDEEIYRAVVRQDGYLTRVVSFLMMLAETGFYIWSIKVYGFQLPDSGWKIDIISQWLYLIVGVFSWFMFFFLWDFEKRFHGNNKKQARLLGAYYVTLLIFGSIISCTYQREGRNGYVLILVLICTYGVAMMHPVKMFTTSILFFIFYNSVCYISGILSVERSLNILEILFFLNIIGLVRYYTLCEYFSLNHKLERYTKVLEGLSFTDELTEVGNRNSLRRNWKGFVGGIHNVCIVDVDNFKEYNDTYGHLTGDFVLRSVAAALKEAFGDKSVYRLGGDEFLVITQIKEEELTKTLRQILIQLEKLTNEQQELGVGLSIGCVRGYCEEESDMRELMKKADEVLYRVKEQGKGNFAFEDLTK
jgi:diguanylate cyclase (GGDEF)-like protein